MVGHHLLTKASERLKSDFGACYLEDPMTSVPQWDASALWLPIVYQWVVIFALRLPIANLYLLSSDALPCCVMVRNRLVILSPCDVSYNIQELYSLFGIGCRT
jgi:hypothetical protein